MVARADQKRQAWIKKAVHFAYGTLNILVIGIFLRAHNISGLTFMRHMILIDVKDEFKKTLAYEKLVAKFANNWRLNLHCTMAAV